VDGAISTFKIVISARSSNMGVKGTYMKTTILVIALIGCVALGILGVAQSRQLKAQREELAQTKQQLAALDAELKEKQEAIDNAKLTEMKAKVLQQTLTQSATMAVEESKKSEKLKASLDEAETNNPMHTMASMLKDPKMRDMIKAQQKMVMGPMIDKQYSDFYKQLNLTPEQTAGLKDLLGKKMLAGTDAGMSMLDDSLDASQRADLTKQAKDQTDEIDNQIKQFLGDDNYKAYQSYEKTVPDRATMSQFSDQFAGTPNALTGGQQEQLVQAMSDARNNFNWTSGLNQPNPGANGDLGAMLTADGIDRFVKEREQFDEQFLDRAQKILTPSQLAAFKEYQATQRELQAASMKMAGQMFKPPSH
jgi:hypothetical protein